MKRKAKATARKRRAPVVQQSPAPKKLGRPEVEIDESVVASLAFAGVPIAKIARHLGVARGTLYNRFSTLLEQNDIKGEIAIYVKQNNLAMAGDKTMLVWLGKTRLGQSEKMHIATPEGESVRVTTVVEVQEQTREIIEAALAERARRQELADKL